MNIDYDFINRYSYYLNFERIEQYLNTINDINQFDGHGHTILMHMCIEHKIQLVEYLINDLNANIELESLYDGKTALIFSCDSCCGIEIGKYLVEHNANIEHADLKYGRTPLLWASKYGNYDFVIYLVEHGADVTYKDDSGSTAATLAFVNGYFQITHYLVRMGCESPHPELSQFEEYKEYIPSEQIDIISLKPHMINDVDDCVICFEKLNEKDCVLTRNCNHIFHKVCLFQWFDNTYEKRECPTCKTPIN